eukprot:365312-Chlamydomonas_euryale.AAC.8
MLCPCAMLCSGLEAGGAGPARLASLEASLSSMRTELAAYMSESGTQFHRVEMLIERNAGANNGQLGECWGGGRWHVPRDTKGGQWCRGGRWHVRRAIKGGGSDVRTGGRWHVRRAIKGWAVMSG